MTPDSLVTLACQHQDVLVALLGTIGVGNLISWFDSVKSKLPSSMVAIVNIAALNWDDVLDVARPTLIKLLTK